MKLNPITWLKSAHNLFGALQGLLLVGLLCGGAWLVMEWGRSRMAGDIYEQRLAALSADYANLRAEYNRAVERTAVTLLHVEGGRVSVEILRADGSGETIPTPYPASATLYVDYLVQNGRLWIRRVFDEDTPPAQAVVIDPERKYVDWDADGIRYGKAVYRKLGEGRWVITVTGNGSLGLEPAPADMDIALAAAPPVADFEAMREAIEQDVHGISPREIAAYLWNRGPLQP